MHGANASGRPFTGDYAGILLYETLHALRLRDRSRSRLARDDGLRLIGCRITNAVKCLPPDNKPTPAEVRELQRLPRGRPAHGAARAARSSRSAASRTTRRCARSACRAATYPFAHGARARACRAASLLFDSYHCSRYNTNTRRLTPAMFRAVFDADRARISAAQRRAG